MHGGYARKEITPKKANRRVHRRGIRIHVTASHVHNLIRAGSSRRFGQLGRSTEANDTEHGPDDSRRKAKRVHDQLRQEGSTRDGSDGCPRSDDLLFHLTALAAAVLLGALLAALA